MCERPLKIKLNEVFWGVCVYVCVFIVCAPSFIFTPGVLGVRTRPLVSAEKCLITKLSSQLIGLLLTMLTVEQTRLGEEH